MGVTVLKVISVEIIKTREGKVKARADVQFEGFLLKGFKIIQDDKIPKEYVTPPSYKSPKGWRALFKTNNPDDWQEIQRRILKEYNTHLMEETANEKNDD